MFGYSIPLLFGRLFGIPLFVLGLVFLSNFRHVDEPKAMLKKSLRSPWVWLALVLTWLAFAFEIVYLAGRVAES